MEGFEAQGSSTREDSIEMSRSGGVAGRRWGHRCKAKMFDVLGNATLISYSTECFPFAQYHQAALAVQYVSVILIANLKVQSLWSARGRTRYVAVGIRLS